MLLVSVTASSYTVRSPTGSVIHTHTHTHTHIFEMTYILCQVGRKTLLIQFTYREQGPALDQRRKDHDDTCGKKANVKVVGM